MKRLIVFLGVACGACFLSVQAAEWQRLSANLMTSWGESIDPENVWQEYPRPQLVRPNWMNLNGLWDYYLLSNRVKLAYDGNASHFKEKVLVPFGVESALSGIMHTDLGAVAKSTLMYRRTFTLTEAFKGKRTLLHFGAVDWRCVVFVNGNEVGRHDGGSDAFTFDITEALKGSGEQELQVAVYDPSNLGGQPRGKQTTNPGSIWYTSCSGIWQTVWLEPVNPGYIERYEVVPDAATGTVRVKVFASDPTCKFSLIVRDGEESVVMTDKYRVGQEVTLTIPDAKLWTPDTPFLYNLDIVLCADNCQECDRARGYFGMRTFSKAMIDGHPAFLLNGKPIFMYGPLDQGWWPDGLLTPPSYEAMIYDLQTIKSLGMNMVRKHIKVENDLWYEWCDRNGLIVWQDMPSGSDGGSNGTKKEIHQNFYQECERIVTNLKQHPSIGVWVVYNEGWGQDADAGIEHTMHGFRVVREADADQGRLMNSVSGWTDFGIGDILDAHSYPSPNANTNDKNERINVCGEFGGITLMVEGHLWGGSQQTYTQVTNSEEYATRFNQYTLALQTLQQTKGLWAGVYTQITDVEHEVNGILTYDRKVRKVNDDQLASIRAMIEQTITHRFANPKNVLAAGDVASGITWRYTTVQPSEGWETVDFADNSWSQGQAGFGKISQPDARVRTTWDTPEIWIRRHFRLSNVTEDDLKALCLRMFYDEDTEVYINGVFAMSITGYNTTYQLFEINDAARKTINLSGDNVIAIHTKQTTGGQYIDAGFSLRSYKSNDDLTIEPLAEVTWPTMTEDPEKAYLLCYTTENAERLFYSYSYDGLTWQSLNEGQSIFGGMDGQPTVQGPFVYRMEDESGSTVFHLVHGAGEDASGLYHWTSEDLVNWLPFNGTDALVIDTKAHSPELGFDPVSKNYYYYWSYLKGYEYILQYVRTKDFVSFTRPQTYFSPGFSAKDLHVFQVGDRYVALFSGPNGKGLCSAYSKSLNPTRSKFQDVREVLASFPPVGAPATIPSFFGDGWLLLGAMKENFSLFSALVDEPQKLSWRPYELAICRIPEEMKEGKVLVITRSELSIIQEVLENGGEGVRSTGVTRRHASDDTIYNLQGQRITDTKRPGIYITDGRKKLRTP